MPRPKRTESLYMLTVRLAEDCADALRMEAARLRTSQGRLLEDMIRASLLHSTGAPNPLTPASTASLLPAPVPSRSAPKNSQRQIVNVRKGHPKLSQISQALEDLEIRMKAANISRAALGRELKITSNAIQGWFKRTGRIPVNKVGAVEWAMKKLEAELPKNMDKVKPKK